MKIILLITFQFLSLLIFSQENPWENKKNYPNPWLSEEERIIEEEKLQAEKLEAEKKLIEQQKVEFELSFKRNDSIQKARSGVKNQKDYYDSILINNQKNQKELAILAKQDALKYYSGDGMGVVGYIITLIPLAGNPIVWFSSISKPSVANVYTTENPRNILLNNEYYNTAYRKEAKKIRNKKMLLGNLLSNITKLIIFLKIIN